MTPKQAAFLPLLGLDWYSYRAYIICINKVQQFSLLIGRFGLNVIWNGLLNVKIKLSFYQYQRLLGYDLVMHSPVTSVIPFQPSVPPSHPDEQTGAYLRQGIRADQN